MFSHFISNLNKADNLTQIVNFKEKHELNCNETKMNSLKLVSATKFNLNTTPQCKLTTKVYLRYKFPPNCISQNAKLNVKL